MGSPGATSDLVTLQLLWTEYVEAAQSRDGEKPPYQYTQFCEHYDRGAAASTS